jgi:hypothetical protein
VKDKLEGVDKLEVRSEEGGVIQLEVRREE